MTNRDTTGNFRKSMDFEPVSAPSIFKNQLFLHIFEVALQVVAGKRPFSRSDPGSVSLFEEALIKGLLTTKWEDPQEPHVDYKWPTLLYYMKKLGGGRFGSLPYSFDVPLTKEGMRLCLYGSHPDGTGINSLRQAIKNGTLLESPVLVEVNYGEAILFR